MNTQEKNITFNFRRHAPKIKGGDPVRAQIDGERANDAIKETAREIFQNLVMAAEGTILILLSSCVERSEQTREGLALELQRLAAEWGGDIEVVIMPRRNFDFMKEIIQQGTSKKFIVIPMWSTWLAGFKEEGTFSDKKFLSVARGLIKELGNEDRLGRLLAAHPWDMEEVARDFKREGVAQEVVARIVAMDVIGELHSTPESQALRLVALMSLIRRCCQRDFPGRPIMVEVTSHNLRLGYLTQAFLGEISYRNSSNLLHGQFHQPLEATRIAWEDDQATLSFRDKQIRAERNFFQSNLDGLKDAGNRRKQAWAEWSNCQKEASRRHREWEESRKELDEALNRGEFPW